MERKKVLLIGTGHSLEELDIRSDLLHEYGRGADSTEYLEQAEKLLTENRYNAILLMAEPSDENTRLISTIRKNQPHSTVVVYYLSPCCKAGRCNKQIDAGTMEKIDELSA